MTREDPIKGRELCEAMARSEHPNDRWFAAFALEDLVATNHELARTLFCELLTDPDDDVQMAARAAFNRDQLADRAEWWFFRNVALDLAENYVLPDHVTGTPPREYRSRAPLSSASDTDSRTVIVNQSMRGLTVSDGVFQIGFVSGSLRKPDN